MSYGLPHGFYEHRYYSAEFDGQGARLSTSDVHGREFYAILEAGHGKKWVARRDKAIAAIRARMAEKDPVPGLVGIWVSPEMLEQCKKGGASDLRSGSGAGAAARGLIHGER